MEKAFRDRVFGLQGKDFPALALEIFRYQYQYNPLYKDYTDALGIRPDSVQSLTEIPFLPIECFKNFPVRTTVFDPEMVFESSGTTGQVPSRHHVKELDIYRQSCVSGFELFYGPLKEWCILGLLPSYLERKNASLVAMVDEWIRLSGHPQSGFYLNNLQELAGVIGSLERQGQKTLLIGVSFALVDFAGMFPMRLQHTVVMETGGMKGRRKEMTREELHGQIKERLGLAVVHSEYGMTELLSQAYSAGDGIFRTVPWMRVLVRKEDDPLDIRMEGEGIVNMIDLANIYSCAFIATDDMGRLAPGGPFEILGRVDTADLRGCNLLVY